MKKSHLTAVIFLVLNSISFAQEKGNEFVPPPPQVSNSEFKDNREIYFDSEVPPQFRGGKEALMKFLAKNMRYPERAIKENIQGKCWARFVVSNKGEISDIQVVRTIPNCPECDAEVIRVIQNMPRWSPGTIDKKPVNTYFDLPINFSLN